MIDYAALCQAARGLSQKAEALLPLFMAAWMDGFVIGTTARE